MKLVENNKPQKEFNTIVLAESFEEVNKCEFLSVEEKNFIKERLDKKEIPPGTYYIRWSIGKIMAARSSNLSEYRDRYSVQRSHSSGLDSTLYPNTMIK